MVSMNPVGSGLSYTVSALYLKEGNHAMRSRDSFTLTTLKGKTKVDVAVYVDDCVWCFEIASVQQIFEEKYSKAFIANFAPCSKFLNCTVCQDLEAGTVSIHQQDYLNAVASDWLNDAQMKMNVQTPRALTTLLASRPLKPPNSRRTAKPIRNYSQTTGLS